ncbi:MAG: THUMP domain-containing protein [Nitrospirota bacterium]
MKDWNVVVSVKEKGFNQAINILKEFGPTSKTEFFNVLVMKVENIGEMCETLKKRQEEDTSYLSFLSRLIPVTKSFTFQTPDEFEQKVKEIVLEWIPQLEGKGFHVRMHRRGFKGRLSSLEEEKMLDEFLFELTKEGSNPGRITFEEPDVIISVETVAHRAGLSLWTREDLQRYPFVKVDG